MVKKITIDVKDVIAGSNYFSQIKEIEVQDPVSKTKIINTQAPFSYSYKGITYYFSNQNNYEEFKKRSYKICRRKRSPIFNPKEK